jgi:hypothetical protein
VGAVMYSGRGLSKLGSAQSTTSLAQAVSNGCVRSRNRSTGRQAGVVWLDSGVQRCYEVDRSGIETKQALDEVQSADAITASEE